MYSKQSQSFLQGGQPNPSSSVIVQTQLNTIALESQVKDVLSSAKSKLGDLNKEIDKLAKENDSIQKQVDFANQHKQELQDKNRHLTDDLHMQRSKNEELQRQKLELMSQLKSVEDELRLLVDRAESQKVGILKEITQLKDMERQLQDQRDKEHRQFEEASKLNRKQLQQLTEQLTRKDNEIAELKMAMLQLNERENARMRQLEREAMQFREMLGGGNNQVSQQQQQFHHQQ